MRERTSHSGTCVQLYEAMDVLRAHHVNVDYHISDEWKAYARARIGMPALRDTQHGVTTTGQGQLFVLWQALKPALKPERAKDVRVEV